jgi:hypothetical protein
MSDYFTPPSQPPLVTAAKARDIARAHKGWAEYLAEQGLAAEARRAERDSQFWMAYSIALAQTPPEDAP